MDFIKLLLERGYQLELVVRYDGLVQATAVPDKTVRQAFVGEGATLEAALLDLGKVMA